MKKLQNNFTTPEQSKRLLELRVPADSADCCLRRILTDGGYCETWRVDVFDFTGQIHDDYLPCWSVGRLIEIINICSTTPFPNEITITRRDVDLSIVKTLIERFKELANYYSLDFSKLEE